VFGLCRAGVLGWWALPSVATGTVLLPFSPAQANLVPAVAFLLIQLPLAVASTGSCGQPGGHSMRRPPRTCRCTWCTLWPACGPVLVTIR
jgi:hypothetical protein